MTQSTAEKIRQREAQNAENDENGEENENENESGEENEESTDGSGGIPIPSLSRTQTLALVGLVAAAAIYMTVVRDSDGSTKDAAAELEAAKRDHVAGHDDGEHRIDVPTNPENELDKDSAILDPDAGIFGGAS